MFKKGYCMTDKHKKNLSKACKGRQFSQKG